MSGDEKDQRAKPQPDADEEPPKKEPLTFEECLARLKANPRFHFIEPTGQSFIRRLPVAQASEAAKLEKAIYG